MMMSLGGAPAAPGGGSAAANLYRLWTTAPTQVLLNLGSSHFTLAEAARVECWSGEQAAWGLSARLRRNHLGDAALIEVFGPDGCAPMAILHRQADGAVRLDDWTGDVRRLPSLDQALSFVVQCV